MTKELIRIAELAKELNYARMVYEQGKDEIMSNYEYDKKLEELERLETENNYIPSNSPTQKVGHSIVSKLGKSNHEYPILSLAKTKSISKLEKFLGDEIGVLSLKLDGVTLVATYDNGKLQRVVTRGNGEIGEDVTHNSNAISYLPQQIPYKDKLVVRGEALIRYSNFDTINEKLPLEEQYKNPRNLCSGSVRQLNSSICKERMVEFIAFEVIEGYSEMNSKYDKLYALSLSGFNIVYHTKINPRKDSVDIGQLMSLLKNMATNDSLPIDGMVLTLDDVELSQRLGKTSKTPNDSIAYKWKDEPVRTTLLDIDWQTSRLGEIVPVAIFKPIEIDGTMVSRASLHNLNMLNSLNLHLGDEIGVIKANMIIPQVVENYTKGCGNNIDPTPAPIPTQCLVCDGETEVINTKNSSFLTCTNYNCSAKLIYKIVHFASRDAMNIQGLSTATIERLVSHGFISSFDDIYNIHKHRDKLIKLEGFKEKSVDNLIDSINKSRETTLARFIYSWGIPKIGLSMAKNISKHFDNSLDKLLSCNADFTNIDGLGEARINNIVSFIEEKSTEILLLSTNLTFEESKTASDRLKNLTFAITGKLNSYKNRKELTEQIESMGGKVTSSISKNLNYLINNDITSPSTKNNKANSLNIPIITEKEFISVFIDK